MKPESSASKSSLMLDSNELETTLAVHCCIRNLKSQLSHWITNNKRYKDIAVQGPLKPIINTNNARDAISK